MPAPDIATIRTLRGDLALQIARCLRRRGLNQVAAARLLDIPQPTLSKIVNGRIDELSLELLVRIAVRAGLPVVMQTGEVPEEAGAYVFRQNHTPAPAAQRSRLAERSRAALIESARKLTAEQRLDAMLEQTQLVSQLHIAGKQAGLARARKGRAATQGRAATMKAIRAGQSLLLLLDVIDVLKGEDVEYAVVGALAAAVYGTIRASADADALVSLGMSKLASLSKVFKSKGLTTELRRGDAGDPIPAMLVISDSHDNRVDLLGGLRGLDPQALSRTIEVPFSGQQIRFVSREDFVAMKCFAGGPQDLEDARVAIATAGVSLDLDLLRKLTRRFGRNAADALEQILGA